MWGKLESDDYTGSGKVSEKVLRRTSVYICGSSLPQTQPTTIKQTNKTTKNSKLGENGENSRVTVLDTNVQFSTTTKKSPEIQRNRKAWLIQRGKKKIKLNFVPENCPEKDQWQIN